MYAEYPPDGRRSLRDGCHRARPPVPRHRAGDHSALCNFPGESRNSTSGPTRAGREHDTDCPRGTHFKRARGTHFGANINGCARITSYGGAGALPASAPAAAPAVPPSADGAAKASGTRQGAATAKAGARKGPDRLELDTTDITGNRELPKVLYIVPWKRSDLGDVVGKPVNSLLDEVLQPLDRDVFRRENRYYDSLQAGPGDAKPGTAQGSQPKP